VFVDRVKVHLRAGDGGAGVVSFRRRRGRPRGRPEGGSGGAGGDVFIEADPSVATLLEYHHNPHRSAGAGTHGQGELRHGRKGEDLVLKVPLGTVVMEEDGTVLADLVQAGQRMRALQGGRGGRGNAAFVGPEHRAPTLAEQGEYGEEAWLVLELKLPADAALVGFPNAGKSTLLGRVSAARPKVADYPFTTLEPHLGVVSVDGREFVLADIPGLIEGAADGKGLGHEFLRHVERARVLVILLDPSPVQEMEAGEQYVVLLAELGRHSPELLARPRVVAVNKIDLPEVAERLAEIEGGPGEVHAISAVTGTGVERLMHAVADTLERTEREAPEREGYILHRPELPGFQVVREADVWVVEGRAAERAVALSDLTDPEAADYVARRLERLGVERALREAGVRPGDQVRIGELVFEFREPPEG
jgi:GTP-binding protein